MSYLGIIDWGIGGLGLYRILKRRTDLPTLYLSDAGYPPYGETNPAQLQKHLWKLIDFLKQKGASHVAIACNSASATIPNTPTVTGIIGHGINAMKHTGKSKIGLLAGRGTVLSDIFLDKTKDLPIELIQQIAQPLSAHVEQGHLSGDELHEDLKKIMPPVQDCQALLLACTHYPAITEQIRHYVNEDCIIIDPAIEMADWILANWTFEKANLADRWFTSGSITQMIESGEKAFATKITNVEAVTIDAVA